MKKIFSQTMIFAMITLVLTSCFQKEAELTQEPLDIDKETEELINELITVTQEEEDSDGEETLADILQEESDSGQEIGAPEVEDAYYVGPIILNDFSSMTSITSPYTLTGKAPRSWFFEGSFPVVLLTLENEVLDESPATGAWLEPVGDSDELSGDDMIEFTVDLKYEVPEESTGEAKIRLMKIDMSGETDELYIDEMVILAD